MKTINITLFLVLFAFTKQVFAQERTKLLKATSQKISIKEGNKPISKDWNWLGITDKPTVFELEKNKPKRKVVFYTDIDSISFDVASDKKYDFKVLLNSKDTCRVQLSTVIPTYQKKCNGCVITSDTIPFFLGKDNYIHIKTKVNNSPDLDFMFDTGAGVVCLTAKGYKKANIALDGNVENVGFGGVTLEKTSSNNKLEINDLEWGNLSIVCIDCNQSKISEDKNGIDGILGYNIFEDKVVEIDYDKSLLIIHNELPRHLNSFTKIDTKENLFIKLNVNSGNKISTGWFFFDTGADAILILEEPFTTKNNLKNVLKNITNSKIIGTGGEGSSNVVLLPKLVIGNSELLNIPTHLLNEKNDDFYKDGIIGNRILKRFNTIVDYPNLTVYLKPNGFINESFKKKDETIMYLFIGLALATGLLAFYFYKRKKQNLPSPTSNI